MVGVVLGVVGSVTVVVGGVVGCGVVLLLLVPVLLL